MPSGYYKVESEGTTIYVPVMECSGLCQAVQYADWYASGGGMPTGTVFGVRPNGETDVPPRARHLPYDRRTAKAEWVEKLPDTAVHVVDFSRPCG